MEVVASYTYRAEVVSVYDGDTVRVNIDQGFGLVNKGEDGNGVTLRLFGINAPELKGPESNEGILSRNYLRGLILNKKVIIKTYKDKREKYGRYLASIYLTTPEGQIEINTQMVSAGHAKFKKY